MNYLCYANGSIVWIKRESRENRELSP